jgi:hypothetical protein
MLMVVMMVAAGRNDDPSFPAITVVMVMMIVLGYLEARPGLAIGFINGVESGFGVRYRI